VWILFPLPLLCLLWTSKSKNSLIHLLYFQSQHFCKVFNKCLVEVKSGWIFQINTHQPGSVLTTYGNAALTNRVSSMVQLCTLGSVTNTSLKNCILGKTRLIYTWPGLDSSTSQEAHLLSLNARYNTDPR
jgi:hypothetical protein